MIENGFALPAAEVFDLLRAVYESTDAFAGEFPQEYPSVGALEARLKDLQARPGGLFLAAREDGCASGFLFVTPRLQVKLRHTADLTLGVIEACRGRGVGHGLLDAAIERLRRDGVIEILYLHVRADNLAAIRLYRRVGFSALATLDRDTRIGDRHYDGVLMRRFIAAEAGVAATERPVGPGGNLFDKLPGRLREELVQEIARGREFRIERIVSTGQATPPGEWLDQDRREWVALLSGSAGLRFEGETSPRVLRPGDFVAIPAHARHRVEWTDPAHKTVWLAIHYSP